MELELLLLEVFNEMLGKFANRERSNEIRELEIKLHNS